MGFFKGDFGFSPLGVSSMQLAIWLAIAGTAQFAPKIAKRIGVFPTCLALHALATTMLFVIAIAKDLGAGFVVALVLTRNALMNSGTPLMRALILDLVPKE